MRCLIFAMGVAVVSAGTIVNFDFGWRWQMGSGTNQSSCSASDFPLNYTGQQCYGLSQWSATTQDECQAACCDALNQCVWQWCPEGAKCDAQGECWVGQPTQCQPAEGWISFASNVTNGSIPNPAPAQTNYSDASWDVVQLPHDFIITGAFTPNGTDAGQAYLPKNVSWYRKHFSVPASWANKHVDVVVEGAFSVSYWWLNGVYLGTHDMGYTNAIFRLDNASLIVGGGDNVLAVFVDATEMACTGWWYEGGGLYRHAYLVMSNPVHITQNGIASPAFLEGNYYSGSTPGEGLTVDLANVNPSVYVANDVKGSTNVSVTFSLYETDGVALAAQGSVTGAVAGGSEVNPTRFGGVLLSCTNASLWSVPRPYLYTLVTAVSDAASGTVLDAVNTSIGLRSVRWDAEEGMFLNEQHVKQRGFCNHNSFTGVGVAVPDRINLFRVQSMRGVGGNAWRTSHNPPAPALLDIMDRLGIVVLDENRVFEEQHVQDMVDMVARDRNHPSIVFWSFCNEAGCGSGGTEPALDFRMAAYDYDGSRQVTANMFSGAAGTNMSVLLDIQGFSHVDTAIFQSFHEEYPDKPLVASECCSCETQRGEDNDLPLNASAGVFYSNYNADCVAQQTQWSNALEYLTGSFVWTLFDYYGEPGEWPHVSSSFGSFDLAGFPKAAVWWYRSWWLADIDVQDAGRPPLPGTDVFVRIVESWQAAGSGSGNRTIHVYTNAYATSLAVNGVPVGKQNVTAMGHATFSVAWAPGVLTADALDGNNNVLATDTKSSWGAASAIVLQVDAPSNKTGTGTALYLDGKDVALVRATIVDASGVQVHDSTAEVTFTVTSGPAFIWATGNGDPSNHENNTLACRSAYHGVACAVVRVSMDASGSDADRALEAMINPEAGLGAHAIQIFNGNGTLPLFIQVQATSPNLPTASILIPLTTNPNASVLAVAAASIALANTGA